MSRPPDHRPAVADIETTPAAGVGRIAIPPLIIGGPPDIGCGRVRPERLPLPVVHAQASARVRDDHLGTNLRSRAQESVAQRVSHAAAQWNRALHAQPGLPTWKAAERHLEGVVREGRVAERGEPRSSHSSGVCTAIPDVPVEGAGARSPRAVAFLEHAAVRLELADHLLLPGPVPRHGLGQQGGMFEFPSLGCMSRFFFA